MLNVEKNAGLVDLKNKHDAVFPSLCALQRTESDGGHCLLLLELGL